MSKEEILFCDKEGSSLGFESASKALLNTYKESLMQAMLHTAFYGQRWVVVMHAWVMCTLLTC